MEKNTFLKLVDRYLEGNATPAEQALLEEYYQRLDGAVDTGLSPEEEQAIQAAMLAKIRRGLQPEQKPVISLPRRIVRSVAAIAAAVALLLAGYWFFMARPGQPGQPVAQTPASIAPEILPAKDAAILTFDSGKQIVLDSTGGNISNDEGITITNENGIVKYAAAAGNAITWHTIRTARGNQYQLELADGSKIYLNSASSLRFPSSFTGDTREVELTGGEAYFDIATNAAKPFYVKTREMLVQVTGTHFNINAYDDEGPVATTLIEGRVNVRHDAQAVAIQPGQQAAFSTNRFVITKPDVNKVVAWRSGFFDFDKMDITAIMRQISRWYDVDVEYQGKPTTEKFGGRISRALPLSQVLKLLEENDVQFKINGNRLTVQ